jgi:hypothetical protein
MKLWSAGFRKIRGACSNAWLAHTRAIGLWFLAGAIGCVHAQTTPGDLLQRVTHKVLETVERLPKYMCTQTIDRLQYEPAPGGAGHHCEPSERNQLLLTTSDRLRLDVAASGGHEMYSWVGESRFEDRTLFELVRNGALSTGSFAAFLMAVFRDDNALFSYKGESNEAGRQVAQFEFRVPLPTSHYIFSGAGKRVTTGYSGIISVDAKTADLVSLRVQTDALPPETDACESSSTLNYSRVHLNGADFLLPDHAQLHILNANGSDLENTAVYSDCHEFLGESTLHFEEPAAADAEAAAKAAKAWEALPEGIQFTVALTDEIDVAVAAAGDKITAKLTAPISDAEHRVLAPKGAAVTGRIIQIRRFYKPQALLRVVLKLETVDVGGVPRPLTAGPVIVTQPVAGNPRVRMQQRNNSASLDNQDPQAVVLQFWDFGKSFTLHGGYELKWSTRSK